MEYGASRRIAGRVGKFTPKQQTIIVKTTGLPLHDGKGSNVINLPPVAGPWPPHSQKWCPIGKEVLAPTISIGHSAVAAARTASSESGPHCWIHPQPPYLMVWPLCKKSGPFSKLVGKASIHIWTSSCTLTFESLPYSGCHWEAIIWDTNIIMLCPFWEVRLIP